MAECLETKTPVAAKSHPCYWCGEEIPKGDRYVAGGQGATSCTISQAECEAINGTGGTE